MYAVLLVPRCLHLPELFILSSSSRTKLIMPTTLDSLIDLPVKHWQGQPVSWLFTMVSCYTGTDIIAGTEVNKSLSEIAYYTFLLSTLLGSSSSTMPRFLRLTTVSSDIFFVGSVSIFHTTLSGVISLGVGVAAFISSAILTSGGVSTTLPYKKTKQTNILSTRRTLLW